MAGSPIAYFITFRCYGTWFHGDERGSSERGDAGYPSPPLPENPGREEWERSGLRSRPASLDQRARPVVAAAVDETCRVRDWELLALNVRTNHVHVVIAAALPPEQVMTSLKAWCTIRLREAKLVAPDAPVWSRHGSTRYLWTDADVAGAVAYVIDGQGAGV